MNVPLPGVTVDPQGVSTSVAITDSRGNTPTAYSDHYGVNTVALPDTITARTTFFLPGEGPWTITPTASGQVTKTTTLTLEDSQVATVTVGSVFDASQWEQFGAYVGRNPIGAVTAISEPAPTINAADAGIDMTAASDSTAALQALCTTLAGLTYKPVIDFGAGGLKTSTIHLTSRGYHFRGAYGGRSGTDAGTQLVLTGAGALFQFGADDGNAWDANSYNGYANQVIEDLYLTTATQDTALSNGQGSYKAGTYAVQAWRGGHIEYRGTVWMQGFEFGHWGIQSDFNRSQRLMIEQCHRGWYSGPRSDQARVNLECNLNDVDLWIDGAWGGEYGLISVSSGALAGPVYPVVVGSNWSRYARQNRLIAPWLEQEQGYNSIRAFIAVSPHLAAGGPAHTGFDPTTAYADTFGNQGFHVDDPNVSIGPQGATNSSTYLLEHGANGGRVKIDNPGGAGMSNFAQTVSFINAATGDIQIDGHHDYAATYIQNGTGSTNLAERTWASGQLYQRSSLGRVWTEQQDRTHSVRDFYIEADTDTNGVPVFRIAFPNDVTGHGTTHLLLTGRETSGSGVPAIGGDLGDRYWRTDTPSVANQRLYTCTTAGAPGTAVWTGIL